MATTIASRTGTVIMPPPARLPAVPIAIYPEPRHPDRWDRDYLQDVALAGARDATPLDGCSALVEAICADYGDLAAEQIAAEDRHRAELGQVRALLNDALESLGVEQASHAATIALLDRARAAERQLEDAERALEASQDEAAVLAARLDTAMSRLEVLEGSAAEFNDTVVGGDP